ncbi:sulfur carrier protein ThiS [Tenacibaculum sp. 190524A02b]
MITIKVNDTQKEFSDTTTLEGLINNLQVKTNGIAIAVNGSVVKKDNWSSQQLQNNDTVLIIKSTQGG